LEEDTARSQHPEGTDYSLLDFNRAGVPLMELVTEPVITTAEEASKFAQELQLILRYLDVSAANMEIGQMRVEANISIHPEDTEEFGTKVEVKNLNSFRAVEGAIKTEIERQTKILNAGEKVVQETRGWNESKGETFSQREKESAHDYRYFPEPDIPPLTFNKEYIEHVRAELPELPQLRRNRFQYEYNLTLDQADVFVNNKDLGEYFEQVVSELGPGIPAEQLQKLTKLSANYLISDLRGLLQGMSVEDKKFKVTAENFAELINMIGDSNISTPAAKALLKKMFETGGDPSQLADAEGLTQTFTEEQYEQIAEDVIAQNPKAVEDYRKNPNSIQYLTGQFMMVVKGAADTMKAQTILRRKLEDKEK